MKRHAVGDFRLVGDPPGALDQLRIDLDPDAARAVLLRGDDRNAPVAGAQIVNDILGGHRRKLQHRIRDVVAGRREMDVGCAGR